MVILVAEKGKDCMEIHSQKYTDRKQVLCSIYHMCAKFELHMQRAMLDSYPRSVEVLYSKTKLVEIHTCMKSDRRFFVFQNALF